MMPVIVGLGGSATADEPGTRKDEDEDEDDDAVAVVVVVGAVDGKLNMGDETGGADKGAGGKVGEGPPHRDLMVFIPLSVLLFALSTLRFLLPTPEPAPTSPPPPPTVVMIALVVYVAVFGMSAILHADEPLLRCISNPLRTADDADIIA